MSNRAEYRRRLKLERVPYPNLMRRIGVLPKLWDAERRALAYAKLAEVAARHREARAREIAE